MKKESSSKPLPLPPLVPGSHRFIAVPGRRGRKKNCVYVIPATDVEKWTVRETPTRRVEG